MSINNFQIIRRSGTAFIYLSEFRVILIRAITLTNIQKRMEEILGDEAFAVLYEAGIFAGKQTAQILLNRLTERHKEIKEYLSELFGSKGIGWFKLETLNIDENSLVESLQITQSFIAQSYDNAKKPVCHFLSGYFAGLLTEVTGNPLICEEVQCQGTGSSCCKFKFEVIED